MKLFDRLIFSEVFWVFLFTAAVFTGVAWMGFGPVAAALNYISLGIPAPLILQIALLNIPHIFVYALPISMLLAAIFTFVRLSENSEVVAFFAGGVSLYRMLVPTSLAALCVSIIGLIINNSVVPYAVARVNDFKTNISKEIKQVDQPFPLGPFRDKDGRLLTTVWVEGGFDDRAGVLRQVTITEYDPKTEQPITTVYADKAIFQGGYNWSLQNATVLGVGSRNQAITLANQELKVSPSELADYEVDPETLNFFQLSRRIDRLRAEHVTGVRADEVNLWGKISLPLASFIFALVGAPLGLRPQRGFGRTIAFASGFVVIVVYYMLSQYLNILADGGKIDPMLAAFLPDFVGVGVAAYLIWRAPT